MTEADKLRELAEQKFTQAQLTLGGMYYTDRSYHTERSVIGPNDLKLETYAHEITRYTFMKQFATDEVLDIGCSSGYGSAILNAKSYTGLDYNKEIIEFANKNYGNERTKFYHKNIYDLLKTDFFSDTIIASECLEHLADGREIAQELKKHCNTLLITVPYREPVGYWGKYHLIHNLTKLDFPEFNYWYMDPFAEITTVPTEEFGQNLICVWKRGEVYFHKPTILCSVTTRNRYDYLFHCLQSIAAQSKKPDKVVIYDDTPQKQRMDIREHPIGKIVLKSLKENFIIWEVCFGDGKGQHINHERANAAGYDYVWRIDDDCIAEPNVLEGLWKHMAEGVGAVAGAVYDPTDPRPNGSGKHLDMFDTSHIQWAPSQGIHEAEHLYSSFLYKANITHYKAIMSPVSFHEESIFTHKMFLNGWKLIVDTNLKTYHFRASTGGTRDHSEWTYAWDRREFKEMLERDWKIKLIYLGVGLGDNLSFKNILPDLKKKYKKIVIGTTYPEVFEDCDVKTIHCSKMIPYSHENVYDFMGMTNWKKSIVEAYREMYL